MISSAFMIINTATTTATINVNNNKDSVVSQQQTNSITNYENFYNSILSCIWGDCTCKNGIKLGK
jgi:hypothetical protein